MTKMAAMPIYDKNLKKNLLLQNQKADDLETWYAASGASVIPSLFKWWIILLQGLFEIRKIAVCFLWLSLPGDYRVTDEALLVETT